MSNQTPPYLDSLRERFPLLGFATYALTPGGPVTFEVYNGDEVYTFSAPTERAAVELAFPFTAEPEPAPEIDTPPTTNNVFD